MISCRYFSCFRTSSASFALSLALIICYAIPGYAEIIDRVVAEVNGEVITQTELDQEVGPWLRKVQREAPANQLEQAIAEVRAQVLASMIDKKLIDQEAARQNITVSGEEIDTAFKNVLAANGANQEAFLKQLEQGGADERLYRSNLRSQLLQNKLLMRDVHSKILITDEMVLDYYNNRYTKQVTEGSYYLLQIGIEWEKGADATQDTQVIHEHQQAALQSAERVRNLALAGQDFRELARRFSDLPSAAEGGDIGDFAEDEMAPYMKQAVAGLHDGEISDIVETPYGYQFFKLLSGSSGGVVTKAPYDQVKEEIRERLFREEMQKQYEAWLKKLKESAYIRTRLPI